MKRLVIVLWCSVVVLDHVTSGHRHNDDVTCHHPPPNPVFNNFGQCVDYFLRYSFPFEKLNAECVAEACPQVTTVCPYNCDGSLNPEALARLGSILTDCIQTQEVICGVNIGQMTVVPIAFTTKTLIDPSMANGTCVMNTGTGYIQYLNNTIFNFPESKNTGSGVISLDMNVPRLTYQGGFTCDFNLTFLEGFTFSRITFPAMLGQANYSLTPTATIDHRAAIEVQSTDRKMSIAAGNFTSSSVSLPPCMVNMFNEGINGFFGQSPADTTAARFLSTFAASGLQAANQSCDREST